MLLASSTVFLTIMLSLAFGIASGYVVILVILRAFGHKQQKQTAPATAVIVTSASATRL